MFDNFLLLDDGAIREAALRELLAGGPWPARNPDQNVADLKAQLAANARGAAELEALDRARRPRHGRALHGACPGQRRGLRARSHRPAARRPSALRDGRRQRHRGRGSASIARTRSAVVDFAGTSAQQPGNFNAPLAVCTAAVLYVFRTLVDADFPLNEGCLRPLSIRVRERARC